MTTTSPTEDPAADVETALSAFSDEQTAAQVKALGAVAYLVKPLDIGQILPVVDSALAQAATRHGAAVVEPAAAAADVMPPPEVLMAVGVLMHRYSLDRGVAFQRLHRMAAAENRPAAGPMCGTISPHT